MANVNPDSPENWGRRRSSFTINGRDADAPRPHTPAPPAPAQPQRPATRAEQAFSAFEQARQEYRASLDALHRRTDLTDEGLADARAELASQHAHKVDATEAEVIALRAEAEADYAATRARLGTVEHTAEGETHATRVWQRHRTALDNAQSPTAKLREIIATVPENEIAVVLQEGPAHLAAHGQPTGWVDQAVEQRNSELAAARERLDKANRLVEVAQVDTALLRKGFQTGSPPTRPLVDATKLGFDPDAA
jgi:hypothetical protein